LNKENPTKPCLPTFIFPNFLNDGVLLFLVTSLADLAPLKNDKQYPFYERLNIPSDHKMLDIKKQWFIDTFDGKQSGMYSHKKIICTLNVPLTFINLLFKTFGEDLPENMFHSPFPLYITIHHFLP